MGTNFTRDKKIAAKCTDLPYLCCQYLWLLLLVILLLILDLRSVHTHPEGDIELKHCYPNWCPPTNFDLHPIEKVGGAHSRASSRWISSKWHLLHRRKERNPRKWGGKLTSMMLLWERGRSLRLQYSVWTVCNGLLQRISRFAKSSDSIILLLVSQEFDR